MPEPTEALLCSKCGENEATSKSPQWCKACRAKYQREYEETKEEKAFMRGYHAGIEAQRTDYIDHWLWFPPDYMVPCKEVAKVLREREKPAYTPKVMEIVSEPLAKT